MSIINDAKDKGADVHQVNPAQENFEQQPAGLYKIPMTFISNYSEDTLMAQQEIFGAVLGIKAYDNVNECIEYVNAHARPLGLYYFGEDKQEMRTVLDRTISGGVAINDVMAHSSCEDLPFGVVLETQVWVITMA
jgi:coniferyl-aldehyde dehydrogenase